MKREITPPGRPRGVPAPRLSVVLFLTWLLLNQSVSAGHLALGALLALAVPWALGPLLPEGLEPRRAMVAAKLLVTVLLDIVRSNVEVARRILGPESAIQPRFIWVPLTIRDPYGIVTLAGIITLTPGTLSADLTEDRGHLLVHAFNVDDEAALVAQIKERYERPLLQVFE